MKNNVKRKNEYNFQSEYRCFNKWSLCEARNDIIEYQLPRNFV